jgi:hypothetical protein
MAKIIENLEEYDTGLFDSATGLDCVTEKVVDVTEDCPGASEKERCLLVFTRDSKGCNVKIVRPYEGEKSMGMSTHFSIEKLDSEMTMAPRDDTFGSWSRQLGMEKLAFRALIEEHAPKL